MSDKIDNHKLLEESVEHWRKDILEPLQAGRKVVKRVRRWEDTGELLPIFADECPLCAAYDFPGCLFTIGGERCPLFKHQEDSCSEPDTNWDNFFHRPTMGNAQKMVNTLEALLKKEEGEKKR